MWIIQELQRDWRLQRKEVGFGEMVTLAEESNGQPNMDSSKRSSFRFLLEKWKQKLKNGVK